MKKRTHTRETVILFIGENSPSSKWEIAKRLSKSYGNIHQTIKKLLDNELIEIAYSKPSAKNEKTNVDYYTLTLNGLMTYFTLKPNPYDNLEAIIERHPSALLTFMKWELFKKAGIKEKMLRYIKEVIETHNLVWRHSFQASRDIVRTSIDRNILFTPLLSDHDQDLAKVCKEDPDLRKFINSEFQELQKGLQDLHEAKAWWASQ